MSLCSLGFATFFFHCVSGKLHKGNEQPDNSFLRGDINKDMFIDNPRNHSIKHLSEINTYASNEEMEKGHIKFYDEKDKMDDSCIQQCERYSTITNLKKETFIIEKTKGNYHRVYSASTILNADSTQQLQL